MSFARVSPVTGRRHTLLIAVLTAMLALPGCGGGDDNGGGEGKPAQDKQDVAQLLTAQANADIRLFCVRSGLKSTGRDLQNVGFIEAVHAVEVLRDQRRQFPDMTVPVNSKHPAVPVDKVFRDNLTTLQRKCGADGRLLAQHLQSSNG
jgi:hypothetical protein